MPETCRPKGGSDVKTVQLDITTQKPVLSIRSRDADVRIRQQTATFRTQVRPARMRIDSRIPRFTVDRSASEAQLNNQPVMDWLRSCAQEAKASTLQGIGRIAREGDRLMRIYDRHQNIAAVVADRAVRTVGINVAALAKPVVEWDPGRMEVEWEPSDVTIDWNAPDAVRYDVTPASIDIQVVQRPSVEIEAVPAGRTLNMKQTGPIRWIV